MRRKRRGKNSFDLVIVTGFVIFYFLIANIFVDLKNSLFFFFFWFFILPVIIAAFLISKDTFSLKTKNKFVFMLKENEIKEMSFIEFLIYKYHFRKSKPSIIKMGDISESEIFKYIQYGFSSEPIVILPKCPIGVEQVNKFLYDFYINSNNISGYVYILSNKSMPGIFKVGKTKNHISVRLNDLRSTGVPDDFNIEMIVKSSNEDFLEKTIHRTLSIYRINRKREFFKIDREQIIMITIDICKRHGFYTTVSSGKNKSHSVLSGDNKLKVIENYILAKDPSKYYLKK